MKNVVIRYQVHPRRLMGAVVTGSRAVLRSFGGQPLERVRPDPCGVLQSGVERLRLLAEKMSMA